MSTADRRGRGRSSVHRLTIPGLVVMALLVSTQVGGRSKRVDPQIVSLVVVALVAMLIVGVVVPLVTTRRVRVALTCRPDAVAGDELPVRVRLLGRSGRVAVRLLDPEGPWAHSPAPAEGAMLHQPIRRGVFTHLRLEVRCTWPLGLCVFGWIHDVALAAPLHVAPRPSVERARPGPVPTETTDVAHPRPSTAAGDAVRTVRPYVPGDSPRLVHWPTTARTGTLIVRELEPPVRVGLVVLVDLRDPAPGAEGDAATASDLRVEQAASRAAGLVVDALRAGTEVILGTHEPEGPVVERVTTTAAAGRRLARAVAGPVPAAPAGWAVEVVRP